MIPEALEVDQLGISFPHKAQLTFLALHFLLAVAVVEFSKILFQDDF